MNFTREPIIETVITPKEGYKLIIRNSKVGGQEEYFIDAVEIVSFNGAHFFRSLEKPKCFLVPVTDYEILEARESRMIVKTPSGEKGIKIAGGREAPLKVKEEAPGEEVAQANEPKLDKRKEKRRSRKRRGKGDFDEETSDRSEEEVPVADRRAEEKKAERPSLIPPPSTLISESIRYKSVFPPEEPPPEPPSEAHVPHTHVSRKRMDENDSDEENLF